MKYSKQARERAAMICAIAASSRERRRPYAAIALDLGLRYRLSIAHMRLAFAAWDEARHAHGGWTKASDAEAEAMLRCGWSPP